MHFTAIVARGLEDVLAHELSNLGAGEIAAERGAVRFAGELEVGYRACLFARSASRVLLPLRTFEGSEPDAVYGGVGSVDWREHLGRGRTLAVECVTARGVAGHTHFLAQRSKDAICDQLRARTGERPSVDRRRPDVGVHVHLGREVSTVSVDLSGAMHRRGYRGRGGEAPLRETLAAGLLLHAGFDGSRALLDPLCGSGTFLVEAALIASDTAPGLSREHHGAVGWGGHDAALWQRLWREAEDRARAGRAALPSLIGHDASDAALRTAREAVRRAGFAGAVQLARVALAQAAPPAGLAPGLVVTNPPYGERLGAESELIPLYEQLGDTLKRRFAGWTAWVLTGSPLLAKRIGLKARSRTPVHNGAIECRLLELPIEGAATGSDGPAWRRASPEAEAFENRLRKNARHFGRFARRRGLECYRVYDADIPEYNVAVDRYGARAVVQEYAPPASVDPELAARRLQDALLVVAEVLELPRESIVLKVRRRQTQGEQYGVGEPGERLSVREGELRFLVELHGHLDTGLFADHRELRARVATAAAGKRLLNLFAYTCTASVAAARAGAVTTSVDLSERYLAWGRDNFVHNDLDPSRHRFVTEEATAYLERCRERFDVIFVNPPTYSRSHRMRGDFAVQRDHGALLRRCVQRLAPGGEVIFSTHARGFALDEALSAELDVAPLRGSVPEDYRRSPHQAFELRPRVASGATS